MIGAIYALVRDPAVSGNRSSALARVTRVIQALTGARRRFPGIFWRLSFCGPRLTGAAAPLAVAFGVGPPLWGWRRSVLVLGVRVAVDLADIETVMFQIDAFSAHSGESDHRFRWERDQRFRSK